MTIKRKYYSGKDFRRTLSIEELHLVARRCVPNFALEYVEGGSESERTLQWNSEALDSIRLAAEHFGRHQFSTFSALTCSGKKLMRLY